MTRQHITGPLLGIALLLGACGRVGPLEPPQGPPQDPRLDDIRQEQIGHG